MAQSARQSTGFGLKHVEVGLGALPLGLTNESDFDVFTEYGGFVALVSKNPDNFMLRFSGSYGTSRIGSPAEFFSEGDVTLTRFDASLLYGGYVYVGAGVGYCLLDHSLSEDAQNVYLLKSQTAEESFGNSLAYTFRIGVHSEGTFGYFVEAVFSYLNPEATATVTDTPTGLQSTRTENVTLYLYHFFHLGIVYRF